MFVTNASKQLTTVTTTIIQNVELPYLLNGTYKTTEIPICPTQAISVNDNAIDSASCIECGICRKLIPNIIEYHPDKEDACKFIEYCNSHKMFVYRWLCLSSHDLSGVEIFIKGFSRNKRVPLVGVVGRFVRFTKCANSVRELGRVQADLKDMANLAHNIIDSSLIESSIVLVQTPSNHNERDYLEKLSGCTIFELTELYNRFMNGLL